MSAFSLFSYRARFSKGAIDAIEAQCALFTADQSLQLTGVAFPPPVVELARRIEKIVGKIRFDRFAESITGPVSTSLVSPKLDSEPPLNSKVYETILLTLRNMVQVMEQYPSAFETMHEEHLRAHFLAQLNGQYGGRATGETFNYQGEADILLRVDGRNVYVAECKFWRGEQQFLETIDQHLSYLTWRDNRSAILVFNRNAAFSDVLRKIQAAAPKHRSFTNTLATETKQLFSTSFVIPTTAPDSVSSLCWPSMSPRDN